MVTETRYEALDLDCVNVTRKVGGLSLAELNITPNPNAQQISFTNVGVYNIYVNNGAADAGDYTLLPTAGNTITIVTITGMITLRFYVAPGTEARMNVQQEGQV